MTGYCKWCDTLTNDIVKVYVYKTKMLLWTGCRSCHEKRNPLIKCPECEVTFSKETANRHKTAIECPQCGEIIIKDQEMESNNVAKSE